MNYARGKEKASEKGTCTRDTGHENAYVTTQYTMQYARGENKRAGEQHAHAEGEGDESR